MLQISGKSDLTSNKSDLTSGKSDLTSGKSDLTSGKSYLTSGKSDLTSGLDRSSYLGILESESETERADTPVLARYERLF